MLAEVLILMLTSTAMSTIHVWEPKQLKNLYQNREIEYTIMNFGVVPYGHTIYGTVFVASPYDACTELSPLKWEKNYGTLILLVERGNCNFSEKVINAQKIGAGFVIIADNNEEDVHKIFPIERSKEMLDKVMISSILISKSDAENIKEAINTQRTKPDSHWTPVELAILFELVKVSNKADLKFILSVDDYRCYDLVLDYFTKIGTLTKHLKTKIHYKIFFNSNQFFPNEEDCISSDQDSYCVYNSFGNEKKDLGLVQETLKQLCIVNMDLNLFRNYIKSVRNSCFEQDNSVVSGFKKCTNDIYDSVLTSSDKKKLEKCIKIGSEENKKTLSSNHDEIKYMLINYSPLIFINGAYYKGNYDNIEHLFETVCNLFDAPPDECSHFDSFQEARDMNSSMLLSFIFKSLIVTCSLAFALVVLFYLTYKRRMRKRLDFELNDKINEALAKYYNEDEDKKQTGEKKGTLEAAVESQANGHSPKKSDS